MNNLDKSDDLGGETVFEFNDKFRIKITDKCNMACPFCHSEGTKKTEEISLLDDNFKDWLKKLRIIYNKVHLTGGEPTLYSDLPNLCKYLKKIGYEVFLTTNILQLNKNLINSLPFISRINISLHTFNPEYFKDFILDKDSSYKYIERIKNNILELKKKINISINTVISNDDDQKVEEVLSFCKKNNILLKLVPDWRYLEDAKKSIFELLENNSFVEYKRVLKIPGSNLRRLFKDKDGYIIEFKDIKPYYLDFWCNDCEKKEKCIEKFAFLRLEGNPLRFKVCIDKPALTSGDFKNDFWPKFKKIMKESVN